MTHLELVEQFRACTLDGKYWTHQAHLIVALFFVLHFQEKAFEKIKTNIIASNEALGITNSDTGGYHETLTLFWIKKVEAFIDTHAITQFTSESVEQLIQSDFANKLFPLQYYSKDLLFSTQARKNWVEPDLKPLVNQA